MDLEKQIFDAVRAEFEALSLKGIAQGIPGNKPEGETISFGDALSLAFLNPEIRRSIIEKHPEYALFIAQKNDSVYFGSYEQDGCEKSIEWTVLYREPKKLLMISKQAIDCKPFHNENTFVSWEGSDMRAWLNGEFYDKAFSPDESWRIPFSSVQPDRKNNLYANHGNSTLDKVFLLSIDEVREYFDSDKSRICLPTAYAVKNGAYEVYEGGPCWWWLRTPGYSPMTNCAAYINDKGVIKNLGGEIDTKDNGVRPVIWVDVI